MRLIGFAVVLAVGLMLAPRAADAQEAAKVWRIGYLSLQRAEGDKSWVAVFRQGLRELGYVEGQKVVIESVTWDLTLSGEGLSFHFEGHIP